ncbi:MAG TPA: hypothetical protein VMH80_04305 [Bryobacteraceae bacterium]|nr:hypothetical protein [Bryobacteraceae bacterium]
MKSAGRVVLFVVLLGLALLVGYGAYIYVLPRWVAILFYGYLAVGVAMVAYGIKFVVSDLKSPKTERQKYGPALGEITRSSGWKARIQRTRDAVALPLRVLANAIVWPVDSAFGFLLSFRSSGDRMMTATELGLRQKADLPEYSYSLYTLAAVAAVFTLGYTTVSLGQYSTLVLILLVTSTSLRHLCYSIETTPLAVNLRRSRTNPYAAFLLIVAADYSTLVLALTCIFGAHKVSEVTLSDLWTMGTQLIHAEDTLWRMFKGTKLTPNEITIGVIGLLFYLALVKTLLEYKEFRRNDEDYVWLANAASRLGNFAAALRQLNNIHSWNAEAYSAKILALIGVNQVEEAEKQTQLLLEHQKKDASPEGVFGTLWQAYLLGPVSDNVGVALLQRAMDLKVRDAFLEDSVGVDAANPLVQQKATDMFSLARDTYPLTLARVRAVSGDWAGVSEILRQFKPAFPVDEVIALVIGVAATVADPQTTAEQDSQNFRDWAAQSLPRIKLLIKEPLQPWEQVLMFSELQRTLLLARRLAPERVEEVIYLGDSVKAAAKGGEATRGFQFTEKRYKELAASR